MKISNLLIDHINRDYFLPSIQREFVWGRREKKVEKLFDSLLQEYPIGSILVWNVNKKRSDKTLKEWEVYEFGDNYNEDKPHNDEANLNGITNLKLILDGQQRLTALMIGLKGSYSFSYRNRKKKTKLYINLFSDIENDIDNTYGLKYEFEFLEDIPADENQLWYDVGEVLDYRNETTEAFKSHYDGLIEKKSKGSKELIIKAKNALGQLHKRLCKDDNAINELEVGISDDEKILNVFVRTNEGGVPLEKADLLLSHMEADRKIFKPKGARKEVFDFVDRINAEKVNKPNYEFTKDDILKACLVLTEGLNVQYKLVNFNRDNLQRIDDNWVNIKKYMELTVNLIAKYGFSTKNIISKNALIPIAYFMMKKGYSRSFVESNEIKYVEIKNEAINWYVISTLRGAFGGASDGTLQRMRKGIDANKSLGDLMEGRMVDRDTVERWFDREYFGSKYSHLLLMLISKTKYWDNCHQDHVYPASKFEMDYLIKKVKLSEAEAEEYVDNANSIGNIQLLTPSVNIRKTDDDFIDWQAKQNKEYLLDAFIPLEMNLSFKNYLAVIKKRKQLMIDALCKVLKVR